MSTERDRELTQEQRDNGAAIATLGAIVGTALLFTPFATLGAYLLSGSIGIGVSAATGAVPDIRK